MKHVIAPTQRQLEEKAARVGGLLRTRGYAMASAESCTGGWIAQCATAIPGSSTWFERAFVTYSNRAKQEMLGVSSQTLDRYGAVSAETVREMVSGAAARAGVAVAVAVSGIAGPDGGSAEKPVGTVYLAWIVPSAEAPVSKHMCFDGDRRAIRALSVGTAFDGLMDLLSDDKKR